MFADNAVFDGEKMLDRGEPPIEGEAIAAIIGRRTSTPKNIQVYAICLLAQREAGRYRLRNVKEKARRAQGC